jgi:glycogen debranching enzyme
MSIDNSLATQRDEEPEQQPNRSSGAAPIVIDGISYIPSNVLLTGIPKVSLKDNLSFAVLDTLGESPRLYTSASELGFYCRDTRYLQTWELTFNGHRPVALAHELKFRGNTVVFSMTNRDMPRIDGKGRIQREKLLIRRVLALHNDAVFETVEIRNFDNEAVDLQIEQWAGGKFDDLFEVRGFYRPKRGKMLAPLEEELSGNRRMTTLQYEGLDGKVRKTHILRYFDAEKIRLSPTLVGYFTQVSVPAKGTVFLKTQVSFDAPPQKNFLGSEFEGLNVAQKMQLLGKEAESFPFWSLTMKTDNSMMNRAIQNAQTDIFTLLTEEDGGIHYPYAGIPWFSAPFGRDGLITAYQLIPWYPEFARGVLEYAFKTLGTRDDPFTDEQPGKVFHEMRRGEMAQTREVPFIPYYGSVDSTPLALILLYEYIRWTMDLESLKRWWPEALRAMSWIEKWGDSDGDGFLEYAKRSPTGLINQGWKDSVDSVMHEDGVLADSPIKLCEVQAYSFRARIAMSGLAKVLGKQELAHRFRLEALQLKIKFTESYWDYQKKYVYLALDGHQNPCKVRSSNMGHCLWSEILDHDQARAVASHLMSPEMFSGYGIRTLADDEVSYNPMSYHNGSIWPHDNSMIMEGLRRYGFIAELEQLALSMIGVLESSDDFRLPELFCGFRRRGNGPPVPYEVACKPQAWAAGSIFLMIRAMLGIQMDVDQNHVVLNQPILTPRLSTLEVKGLRGRDWELDLLFRRGQSGVTVDVTRKRGTVRVLTVK